MATAQLTHAMAVDAVAVLLLLSVGGKLVSGVGTWQVDLRQYVVFGRVRAETVRALAWVVLSGELLLAIGLLFAPSPAPFLLPAAGLFAVLGFVLSLEIRGGRAGEPCFCFGPNSRSTVSWRAVGRNLLLAVTATGLAVISPALTPAPAATRVWAFLATVSVFLCWFLWSAIVRTRRLGDHQLEGMGVNRRELRTIQVERHAQLSSGRRGVEWGS